MSRSATSVRSLGLLLVVAAFGCGDEASDVPPPPPDAAAAPAAGAATPEAAAGTAEQMPYLYNPLGKRDPFRNLVLEQRMTTFEASSSCSEPLCQWSLEQLALVAVVSGDANPVAMLEDPNRVGHIVRRNARVGRQGGKVTRILRDCVIVTEYWTGPDGKANPSPQKICIQPEVANGGPVMDLLNQKRVQ